MRKTSWRRSVGIVAGIAGCVGYLHAGQAPPVPNPVSSLEPRSQMFAPEQHDLYDGHYVLSANRIYIGMVGH